MSDISQFPADNVHRVIAAFTDAPAFSDADYSLPTPEIFARQGEGFVRGRLTGISAGPVRPWTIPGAPGLQPQGVVEATAALHVNVASGRGAAAVLRPGSDVTVVVPLWRGPADRLAVAVARWVDPLVGVSTTGVDAFIAVDDVSLGAEQSAELASITGAIVADDHGVMGNLADSQASGAWNEPTLDAVDQRIAALRPPH